MPDFRPGSIARVPFSYTNRPARQHGPAVVVATGFGAADSQIEAAIISVKTGRNVGVAMVRDLKGVIEREKAPIGILVCVANPSREMEREAAAALVCEGADGRTYPRLQIFTLAEYFAGSRPKVPLLDRQAGYKKAAREDRAKGAQSTLDL
jgi:site-specific DNA-methyltransferase (adenine-specific)